MPKTSLVDLVWRRCVTLLSTPVILEATMRKLREELRESEYFLANVGRCITRWALVQEQLFEICRMSLKAPRKQTAITYYRTPTLDSRMKLVDELVNAVLPQRKSGEHPTPIEKAWKGILKEFNELIPERNAMAHFPLKTIVPKIQLLKGAPSARKMSLRPHKNERLRGKNFSVERMDADMLPKHYERVSDLEVKMYEFRIQLRLAMRKKP